MYDIEIDYTTGNSFGRDRQTEMLGNPVTSLDQAKENLKRIKKHYLACRDNPNTGEEFNLTLMTDMGERKILPFWIGYFETLHGAKIVADVDTDMEFTI